MTATVRSVRVVMEAEVAKYIADMKLAGRETKKAFEDPSGTLRKTRAEVDDLGTSSKSTSKDVDGLGAALGRTARKSKEYSLETALAEERASRLRKELRDQARAALDAERAAAQAADSTEQLGRKSGRASTEIDKLSGRVRVLRDLAITLGPALIPLSAAAVGGVAGVTAGVGAGVAGIGALALAWVGLGDAMKAVNNYDADQTVENFQKMQEQLDGLGKSGAQFVRYLHSLEPELKQLQFTARDGIFPGTEKGIDAALTRLPQLRTMLAAVSQELGDLSQEAGEALASDRWNKFFDYIGHDAAPLLDQMGHTLGNLTLGFANLITGFAPVSRQFAGGLDDMASSFAHWSENLDHNQGFQAFLRYIETEGPQAIEFLGALTGAIIGVAEAASPIGSTVLPVLTELLKILSAIANSPFGPTLYTTVAATIAVGRAAGLATKAFVAMGLAEKGAEANALSLGSALRAAIPLAAALEAAKIGNDTGNWIANKINPPGAGTAAKDLNTVYNGDITSKIGTPGNFLYLGSRSSQASSDLKGYDQDLASMVYGGNANAAAAQFDAITKAAQKQGVALADVNKSFPQYADAVKASTSAQDDLTRSTQETTTATWSLTNAVAHADDLFSKRDAMSNYTKSLDALTKSMKKSSDFGPGSDNYDNLTAFGQAVEQAAQAIKDPKARNSFISQSLKDLKALPATTDAAKRQIRQVATALRGLKDPKLKITADTRQALSEIAKIRKELANVPRSVRTDWYVNQVNALNKRSVGGKDGDPSTPFASGGFTGTGGKYEPAGVVHRGEVVLPKEVVKRDAPMLKSRYGYLPGMDNLPGYAAGGLVGGATLDKVVTLVQELARAGGVANSVHKGSKNLSYAGVDLSGLGIDRALKKLETAADGASTALDATKASAASLSDSITQGLTKDIWSSSSSGGVFSQKFAAGSIGGANAALTQQISDSKEYLSLEKALKGKVTGAAYTDLIGSGDIDRLRAANASSASDLKSYSTLFASAQSATAAASSFGSSAVYGKKMDEQTTELKKLNVGVKSLKTEKTERAAAAKAAAKTLNSVAKTARRAGGKKKKP